VAPAFLATHLALLGSCEEFRQPARVSHRERLEKGLLPAHMAEFSATYSDPQLSAPKVICTSTIGVTSPV
jgi:hypothetical protein